MSERKQRRKKWARMEGRGQGLTALGTAQMPFLGAGSEYPKNPSHCPSLLGAVGLNDDTLLLSG